MATGTGVKSDQDNDGLTMCHDERKNKFKNYVDSNPDLFLAASLQFLHRLLAERTFHCTQLGANDVPMPRLEVEDIDEKKNTARQLYHEQIDQIEEFKRQLRSMENFLSAIQLDAENPARITGDFNSTVLDETNIDRQGGDPLNFGSTRLHNDSYDSLRAAAYAYPISKHNEMPVDIPKQGNIDVSRMKSSAVSNLIGKKDFPDAAGDFSDVAAVRNTVVPTSDSLKKNGIQNSASYADIVRSAISGLARNCGKERESRRKKFATNSWLPEAEIMESPKDRRHQKGYETEIESEISSECHVHDGNGSDIQKEIPLRVRLATQTDVSPRKPATVLVRVPNTVFSLLNRKISKRDTKISSGDSSADTRIGESKRKKRLSSVFRNLLKGKRASHSTSVHSAKEKLSSRVTLVSEKTDNDKEDRGNYSSRNKLGYVVYKSASCESFAELQNAERESRCEFSMPPRKSVNEYEKVFLDLSPRVISYKTTPWYGKTAGSTRRKLVDDKPLLPEVRCSKTEILKDLTNFCDEKIISLRCSEGSPQLGNNPGRINQPDENMFLKLATEMRKTQVYRGANGRHVEIPVEIKTTETPLRLRKIHNCFDSFLDDRIFDSERKSFQAASNRIETEQFLQMLVGTLPEGSHFPQTKNVPPQQLLSSLESMENGSQNNFESLKNREDSALDVLLRHIATAGTSMTSCTKLEESTAEKDTISQTAPKRQLSKMSVCYSSESLSDSDNETPEVGTKNSPIDQDKDRVQTRVMSNDLEKLCNEKYFHRYQNPEKTYSSSTSNDKFVIHVKSENWYVDNNYPQTHGNLAPCDKTEVIIEEQNCSIVKTEVTPLSVPDTKQTILCHSLAPVLSKQIFGERKELADAMIRWWGPQINYSTTPSSQTQLSAYSVSVNNLM